MRRFALVAALLLLGCSSSENAGGAPPGPVDDRDGDGFTPGGGDCDDDDPRTFPDAREVPYDGVDQDCDGADLVDADSDGFVAADVGGPDCDDHRPGVHPGADERCDDGVDQDCDGADASCGAGGTGPGDGDGDGFTEDGGDCDDGRSDVHPGADEIPNDGIDQDCSGGDLVDLDGDGYRSTAVGGTDCDDGNAAVHPGAPDACEDGLDADCRGGDPVCPEPPTDRDGDGHASLAAGGDDCDDTRAEVHPSAREIPFDSIDQDCDGNDLAPRRDSFAIAPEILTRATPAVASVPGGFLVAWLAAEEGGRVLRVRPLDLTGQPAGPVMELDRGPDAWGAPDIRLSLVATGADAVAFWDPIDGTGATGSNAVRLDAAGRPLTAPVQLPDARGPAGLWGDAGLLLSWELPTDVGIPDLFVQQLTPALSPAPRYQVGTGGRPSLARDADGTPLLARTRVGVDPRGIEVHRLEAQPVPVFSRDDWEAASLSPRSRRLAAVSRDGLEVLTLGADDAFTLRSHQNTHHAWAEEGPVTVLGWAGLTDDTPADLPGQFRGQALHLTVLDGASPPRTLDLLARARPPMLSGVALRDRRVLVLWTSNFDPALYGMIVRLEP